MTLFSTLVFSQGNLLRGIDKRLVRTLVTQPMLQRRPNRMELRSMDSYIQILYRFQQCKQNVPPLSLLSNEKSPFIPPKDEKNLP